MTPFICTYLKNVFCLNLCVVLSFQRLKIRQYSCGLNIEIALTLNQNPIFEMGSGFMRVSYPYLQILVREAGLTSLPFS